MAAARRSSANSEERGNGLEQDPRRPLFQRTDWDITYETALLLNFHLAEGDSKHMNVVALMHYRDLFGPFIRLS